MHQCAKSTCASLVTLLLLLLCSSKGKGDVNKTVFVYCELWLNDMNLNHCAINQTQFAFVVALTRCRLMGRCGGVKVKFTGSLTL